MTIDTGVKSHTGRYHSGWGIGLMVGTPLHMLKENTPTEHNVQMQVQSKLERMILPTTHTDI
jgi:hypothetical protein